MGTVMFSLWSITKNNFTCIEKRKVELQLRFDYVLVNLLSFSDFWVQNSLIHEDLNNQGFFTAELCGPTTLKIISLFAPYSNVNL